MNLPVSSSFLIRTFGCKVNQYESELMREHLIEEGFVERDKEKEADFYIINSCTVTGKADKETRNMANYFHRVNPGGKIVIAGCYAELENDRKTLMAIPGVAHLVRNSEKGKIGEILTTGLSRAGTGLSAGGFNVGTRPVPGRVTSHESRVTTFKGRDRAFIKIQDGCGHHCSYCKVSLVRGPSRSRNTEDIIAEAKSLIEKGFKELVLTGICLGAWGNLAGLVREFSRLEGMFKIRLSSIEPGYVADELIDVIKSTDKICKHLHMPLQSGDDKILKAMNRPYTAGKYMKIIKQIRTRIRDAAITTDVLVGFPGEGKREFLNTVNLLERIRPSRMHVFPYSKRDGTVSAKYACNLDKETLKERVKLLVSMNVRLSMDFARRFVGKTQDAVIESERDSKTGLLAGYTDRYIRILAEGPDPLKNRLLPVKITGVDPQTRTVLADIVSR